MSSFILALKTTDILTPDAVSRLKTYIKSKWPISEESRHAAIFADAINQVLDHKLPQLPEEQKKLLKRTLLQTAVSRPVFVISSADVFFQLLSKKTMGNQFFKELGSWIKSITGQEVKKERLFQFILQVYKKMDEYPDLDIRQIVSRVEAEMDEESLDQGLGLAGASQLLYPKLEAQVPESSENTDLLQNLQECIGTAANRVHQLYALLERFLHARPKLLREAIHHIFLTGFAASMFFGAFPASPTAYTPFASAPGRQLIASLQLKSITEQSFSEVLPTLMALKEAVDASKGASQKILEMKATAYDLSVQSCGKKRNHPEYGITYSGVRAKKGRTVAVDPRVIPLGSKLKITFPAPYSDMNGSYVAEDTGSLVKGNHVDIFMGEDLPGSSKVFKEALRFGVQSVTVEILEP